jgi:phospholipase/carboxylesterase
MTRSLLETLLLPEEGFYSAPLPQNKSLPPVRWFVPTGYEPNYAYPLIVFFHGHGGSDEQAIRLAPRISRRNYIFMSIRGPETLETRDDDGLHAYGWGSVEQEAANEDYALKAIAQTCRKYHIHTERVYLAGINDGARIAYKLALKSPEKFAGLIAINAQFPRPEEGPLFHGEKIQHMRMLLAHGAANEAIPLEQARRDFLALYGAGVDVTLNTYPATTAIHPNMLLDINRWMVRNVNQDNSYEFEDDDDLGE